MAQSMQEEKWQMAAIPSTSENVQVYIEIWTPVCLYIVQAPHDDILWRQYIVIVMLNQSPREWKMHDDIKTQNAGYEWLWNLAWNGVL